MSKEKLYNPTTTGLSKFILDKIKEDSKKHNISAEDILKTVEADGWNATISWDVPINKILKKENKERDVMVEKDTKFFDLLGNYFYYEDNGYLELYLSKDFLFTIKKKSKGDGYELVANKNDFSIKEIKNYWSVDNRCNINDASLQNCFLQYLRIKLLSFCE